MAKLDELLGKEMTRKQFLATIGLGIMSIFGLSAIMGVLSGNDQSGKAGYGSQTYGH